PRRERARERRRAEVELSRRLQHSWAGRVRQLAAAVQRSRRGRGRHARDLGDVRQRRDALPVRRGAAGTASTQARQSIAQAIATLTYSPRPCQGRRSRGCESASLGSVAWASCTLGTRSRSTAWSSWRWLLRAPAARKRWLRSSAALA